MGWSYNVNPEQTKAQFVAELCDPAFCAPYTIEATRVVGNHVWSIHRHPDHGPMIVLFLIAKARGPRGGWGYKDVTEAMGPAEIDCPLALLDACHVAAGPYAPVWRARVQAYHARKARERARAASLTVGARVRLVAGLKLWDQPLTDVCITSTRPLLCRRVVCGQVAHGEPSIKLRASLVAEVIA